MHVFLDHALNPVIKPLDKKVRVFCKFLRRKQREWHVPSKEVILMVNQRTKKVVSHSLGLVDFVIRLADCDHHLPDGLLKFFGE